jgi:hypothetical protein
MRCASKRSWYRGAASKGRNGWRVDSYWRATRQHPQFTRIAKNRLKPERKRSMRRNLNYKESRVADMKRVANGGPGEINASRTGGRFWGSALAGYNPFSK